MSLTVVIKIIMTKIKDIDDDDDDDDSDDNKGELQSGLSLL